MRVFKENPPLDFVPATEDMTRVFDRYGIKCGTFTGAIHNPNGGGLIYAPEWAVKIFMGWPLEIKRTLDSFGMVLDYVERTKDVESIDALLTLIMLGLDEDDLSRWIRINMGK